MMCIEIKNLKNIVDPLNQPPWQEWTEGPIDTKQLDQLVVQDLPKPAEYDPRSPETPSQHLARIAYYAKNGWNDEPITLVLKPNIYPIFDGIHRTIAAMYKNQEFILANVEGKSDLIKKLYE